MVGINVCCVSESEEEVEEPEDRPHSPDVVQDDAYYEQPAR